VAEHVGCHAVADGAVLAVDGDEAADSH
jgi:hypothetical protein